MQVRQFFGREIEVLCEPFAPARAVQARAELSLILLVIGIAGFVGTTLVGAVLKRAFYSTLIAIPILMAAIGVALIVFGGRTVAVAALLGLWGLVATAAPVGWWGWIARTFPKNAEAGGGLMVAIVQLAIALGSTAGGWLFDTRGYPSTFVASVALLLVASLLTFLTSRADAARSA